MAPRSAASTTIGGDPHTPARIEDVACTEGPIAAIVDAMDLLVRGTVDVTL